MASLYSSTLKASLSQNLKAAFANARLLGVRLHRVHRVRYHAYDTTMDLSWKQHNIGAD
jgi:hypothetical protein